MPRDKSLFHYGNPYHRFIDPLMKPSRRKVIDYIPEGKSVIDIGCGTGELCFELRGEKQCQVVGVDLSLTMLDFASDHNPYPEVRFFHQDATDLEDFQDGNFDYAIIAFLIHEVFSAAQQKIVAEAWRVAQEVVFVDSSAPLPWNITGIVKRGIEVGVGFEHYPQFRSYIDSGGVMGILEAAGLDSRVTYRRFFSQNCHEIVAITH